MNENTQQKNHEGKNNSQASLCEENEERGCMAKWACILGVYLPQNSKIDFPQKWVFPKFEFVPILLPLHAITNSTTF